MASLVCEGTCNPTRAAVDAAVRAYRLRERVGGGTVEPVPAGLAGRLRALVHTEHRYRYLSGASGGACLLWVCERCKHGRMWG